MDNGIDSRAECERSCDNVHPSFNVKTSEGENKAHRTTADRHRITASHMLLKRMLKPPGNGACPDPAGLKNIGYGFHLAKPYLRFPERHKFLVLNVHLLVIGLTLAPAPVAPF